MTNFPKMQLIEPLQRALAEIGYSVPTPVQAESLPVILAGKDVVGQAQTGSGKTAAFGLGILNRLDAEAIQLQAMVLCPTRELADQVSRELRRLAVFIPNVKILTLCGGVPLRPHLASLAHEPHIVVGTPGRLLDLLEKGVLPLQRLKVLVIDEADRMLDMGFAEAMADIIRHVPADRQTLLFSATMPAEIRDISRDVQKDPVDITIESGDDKPQIAQTFFKVDVDDKMDALNRILRKHRPETAVIFCNMREDVRKVATELKARGFSVLALHGELDQRQREEMLVQFANRSANVLVASDVAARGLDISDLAMVVNFTMATDADTHVHRIGRTGRAGQSGIAFNLVSPREMRRAEQVEERLGETLFWDTVPVDGDGDIALPPFLTLAVDAGRTHKLRPGDLLGALTGDAGIPGDAVGKIDIFPTRSYVAIATSWATQAAKRLRNGKIKGRKFRIRTLHA